MVNQAGGATKRRFQSPAALRFQLGAALAAAGQPGPAIAQFEEFLRLRPGDRKGVQAAQAHNNLSILLASTGRAAEAIPHFATAVRLAVR